MLKKIIKIQNIGRFADYAFTGGSENEFRKTTIFYAENGSGKTTLAAIFRSLQGGKNEFIDGRKTFGSTENPQIELLIGTQKISFKEGSWNHKLTEMEIFDSRFIHDNIYAGLSIEVDQRRNLYQFVIGEQGVQLVKELETLEEKIKKNKEDIISCEKYLVNQIKGDFTLNKFIDLPREPDLDNKIASLESQLTSISKAEDICKYPLLKTINLPTLETSEVEQVLQSSLEDISKDVEEAIHKQIDNCMDEKGETWLRQGLGYLKDEKCPYCSKKITTSKLIKAYRGYFSVAYSEHLKKISNLIKENKIKFDASRFFTMQSTISTNQKYIIFWKDHIPSEFPDIDFSHIQANCDNLSGELSKNLDAKLKSPLESLSPNLEFTSAVAGYIQAVQTVDDYNNKILLVNQQIEEKKKELLASNSNEVKKSLDRLYNVKKRFDAQIDEQCRVFQNLQRIKKDLETSKKDIKKNLDEYTTNIFGTYASEISKYLNVFGAGFSIIEPKTSYAGGKPSSSYKISINNTKFDQGSDKTPDNEPSFKNTLSDGDKNTLAFAFFLARLSQDSAIENKILVIDDPICSLDNHRKTCTQQQISRLTRRAKQTIILSHDPYFLQLVWNDCDKNNTNLFEIHKIAKNSIIRKWDIKKFISNPYYKNHAILSDYLAAGSTDLLSISRSIRPLLEANLRMRFPNHFQQEEWLGDFIKKINDATLQDALFCLKDKLPEIGDINNYSKKYHHDQNPGADSELINETELKSFVERTLHLIRGV